MGRGMGSGLPQSSLLVIWPWFRFGQKLGSPEQFLQTAGGAPHGKVEVEPSLLEEVINKE